MKRVILLTLLATSAMASADVPSPTLGSESDKQDQVRIDFPVTLEGEERGGVEAILIGDALRSLDAQGLANALRGTLDSDIYDTLRGQGRLQLAVEQLAALGIDASFDKARLVVEVELAPAARAAQIADFSRSDRRGGFDEVFPSRFALGLTGNVNYARRGFSGGRETTSFDTIGFANVGGASGVTAFFSGAYRRGGGETVFERGRLVAFHDDQKRVLRYSAGDLYPEVPTIAGAPTLAGFSIERRYEDLQPLRNVRPTGSRSFLIERPSRIEIYADGALISTRDVMPGRVDLRDIPATALASNISIVVEDQFGRRELDRFGLSNDIALLAPGLVEFSASAGLLGGAGRNFSYSNDPGFVGSIDYGLADTITGGAFSVLAQDHQLVGAKAATVLGNGIVLGQLAGSRDGTGTGLAGVIDYRGDPLGLTSQNGQLIARLEARTPGFRTRDAFGSSDRVRFDAQASYRLDVSRTITALLGGTYVDYHDTPRRRSYAVDAGVQFRIGRLLMTTTARYLKRFPLDGDIGALLTLSAPIGRQHYSTASHDTISNTSRLTVRRRAAVGIPRFDYSGTVVRTGGDLDGSARATFSNSRIEVDGLVSQLLSDGGADETSVALRVQSGFAYVDGSMAIGRDPARGFTLVKRHGSLKGSPIDIFSNGTSRRVAQVNGFGPAVVPQTSAYRSDRLTFNILDAPFGYDAGAGEYEIVSGAATGQKVEIGTQAYRTATVYLTDPAGEPIRLVNGVLHHPDGSSERIFTNSNGRAVLSSLGQGEFVIEMGGRFQGRFTVRVSDDTMLDLGTLQLETSE